MPIIQIIALPQRDNIDVQNVLKTVCQKVAELLKVPEHSVWGTWQTLPPGWYIEGTKSSDIQPISTHPPIVRVLLLEGRSGEQIVGVLRNIAEVLAQQLNIESENLFIIHEEVRRGRAYAGGDVIF